MFSFFVRNWRKIETALKIVAFAITLVIQAINSASNYAEDEMAKAQVI
jgi:hypothetical protein